jgi:hypothetical protein
MVQLEADLIAKLLRIEALHAGATTPGERAAAENAMNRVRARLREANASDPPVEYRFKMQDRWSRSLFLALLRRYGLSPYRYRGQRHTTVMVSVPRRFVDQTLWPEFVALDIELRAYLSGVTDRVIREALHADTGEADERDEPAALHAPP